MAPRVRGIATLTDVRDAIRGSLLFFLIKVRYWPVFNRIFCQYKNYWSKEFYEMSIEYLVQCLLLPFFKSNIVYLMFYFWILFCTCFSQWVVRLRICLTRDRQCLLILFWRKLDMCWICVQTFLVTFLFHIDFINFSGNFIFIPILY